MATYYIDPVNGNDADDGLSWANAFLTLNGAEDEPVAAADVVYVGPGVYRELLIIDVSGNAGNPITYIADVTGEHTDGIGGAVRVTGSDNDQTAVRAQCIRATVQRDYRTFRGFLLDFVSATLVDIVDGANWIIEDCVFGDSSFVQLSIAGANQVDHIIRRCFFGGTGGNGVNIFHSATVDDVGHLIENCAFGCMGGNQAIKIDRIGGITVKNCSFVGHLNNGVRVQTALSIGQQEDVNNSIFVGSGTALRATALGEIVEDFNTFFGNTVDRNTVNIGGNSVTHPPLFNWPILHAGASQVSGFKFPWWFVQLSEWSQVRAITGSNEPTGDFYGIPRPATASKNSWGLCQFVDMELESGTVQAGTYSRVLHDAGQVLVRRIPVTGVEITVTLYVRREANYAGNLPQMVIKQPGQADQVTVMVAAVNTWEQLSDTFTPASPPGFVEVWAESRNTAAAGNYEVFYDTMGVS